VKHVLKSGTIKRLHVNRAILRRNVKADQNAPALTVQTSRGSLTARRVEIRGSAMMLQSRKPLSCGARAWVETCAEVILYT